MVCIGIVGPSNTGKTTLIEALIPLLAPRQVGVLKHSHHQQLNHNDTSKDSGRYRAAGACFGLCVSADTSFEQAINTLPNCDYLIVESFRSSPIQKILYCPNPIDPTWSMPRNIIAQVGANLSGVHQIMNSPNAVASWIQFNSHRLSYTGKPG